MNTTSLRTLETLMHVERHDDTTIPGSRPACRPLVPISGSISVAVRPAWITGLLCAIAAFLLLAGVIGQVLKYRFGVVNSFGSIHLFDLDAEENIPTWFSSGLLALCAALLGVIARAQQHHHAVVADELSQSPPRRPGPDDDAVSRQPAASLRGYWSSLAVIFTLMSIDEVAEFHEMTIAPLRAWLHVSGIFFYAWIIPGAIFVAAVLVFMVPFLRRLPLRTSALFVTAGSIYVAGALGMEAISGWYAARTGTANLSYAVLTHVEESLEMAGCILMIYALLDFIRRRAGAIFMNLCPASQPQARDPSSDLSNIPHAS